MSNHSGHRKRMREKLFADGNAMTDHELVEMLLFTCIPRKNTNPIAHALVNTFGDLNGLFDASPRLLMSVDGVGEEVAEHISLYGQLLRRMTDRLESEVRLVSFYDLKQFAMRRFAGSAGERLEFYFTDADGMLLHIRTVSNVYEDRVASEVRPLSRLFADLRPATVFVVHNHPSGNPAPSAYDDAAVLDLLRICLDLGVKLGDSVIFAGAEVYSYYQNYRLDELRRHL